MGTFSSWRKLANFWLGGLPHPHSKENLVPLEKENIKNKAKIR